MDCSAIAQVALDPACSLGPSSVRQISVRRAAPLPLPHEAALGNHGSRTPSRSHAKDWPVENFHLLVEARGLHRNLTDRPSISLAAHGRDRRSTRTDEPQETRANHSPMQRVRPMYSQSPLKG